MFTIWPFTEKYLLRIALSAHCGGHLLESEGKVLSAAIYHLELFSPSVVRGTAVSLGSLLEMQNLSLTTQPPHAPGL